MEHLYQLAYIAIVLLLGTLASVLAYSLKTSDIFILVLTGMIFEKLGLLHFEKEFVLLISILAIIFIVFNNTFKINFSELKTYFLDSLELNAIYFIVSIVVIVPSFMYLFDLDWYSNSLMLAFLFAVLCYGTDSVMCIQQKKDNRMLEVMEIESLINPPITSVVAFLVLAAIIPQGSHMNGPVFVSFFTSIFYALIIGILVSMIILSVLKKNYFGNLTHLAVITSAILCYVITEFVGGLGALSVAVYGLFFGNSHISHLIEIEKFESIISNSIKILTFILLGTVLVVQPEFIAKGSILFLICLIVRFISVAILARKEHFHWKELIFMTLNIPKNIEVSVILLIVLSVYSNILNMNIVINVTMLLILYSIALSTISAQFYSTFFKNHTHHVKKIKRH